MFRRVHPPLVCSVLRPHSNEIHIIIIIFCEDRSTSSYLKQCANDGTKEMPLLENGFSEGEREKKLLRLSPTKNAEQREALVFLQMQIPQVEIFVYGAKMH